MLEHGGVWLPDGERHMVEWMNKRNQRDPAGRLTYQYHKLQRALTLTQGRGAAVDVGAHVGFWSMYLADEFDVVHAFEPVREHVECLQRNCAGRENLQIHEMALGERADWVSMHKNPTSSGDTYPIPGAKGSVRMGRYDDLEIQHRVDLVKLDCEGYELFALRGMRAMLERDHPVVVVEQKPRMAPKFGLGPTDAVTFLESMGARQVAEMGGDYFLRWG